MNVTGSRNNNFNEKQIKGIDMSFNGTKKKYPFLNKWSFSSDFEKYASFLYIVVFIDMFEVANYLNLEVKDYYKNNEHRMSSSALSVFFKKIGEQDDWGARGINDEVFEIGYKLRTDIENHINSLYDRLPDDFKIFYNYDGIFGLTTTSVKLKIDNFIHINN